jgi:hypothetical protein
VSARQTRLLLSNLIRPPPAFAAQISIGYDHVNPSQRPEKWNLRVCCTALVLGFVLCSADALWLAGAAVQNDATDSKAALQPNPWPGSCC